MASFLYLTFGAIIAAFSIEEFLVPNNLFDGGVTGISMILAHFIPVNLGVLIFLVNLPFVYLAYKKMGHRFVINVVYAIMLFSVMTGVFEPVREATDEMLLAVTYGGVLLGVGVGMVLRGGGCLDGTEIVAVILNRNLSISVGQIILGFNVIIFGIAGAIFDLDRGMYSLLMYFVSSKVIDIVEIGFENAKSVIIISNDGQEVVSNGEKDILYCVITRAEIYELKQILREIPGSTFTTISDVSEIVGNHIKGTTT